MTLYQYVWEIREVLALTQLFYQSPIQTITAEWLIARKFCWRLDPCITLGHLWLLVTIGGFLKEVFYEINLQFDNSHITSAPETEKLDALYKRNVYISAN